MRKSDDKIHKNTCVKRQAEMASVTLPVPNHQKIGFMPDMGDIKRSLPAFRTAKSWFAFTSFG